MLWASRVCWTFGCPEEEVVAWGGESYNRAWGSGYGSSGAASSNLDGGGSAEASSQGSGRQKGALECAEDFFGQTTDVRRGPSGSKDRLQAKMRGCYSLTELVRVS